MKDFVSSARSIVDAPRDCKFVETFRLLQASCAEMALSMENAPTPPTPPPPTMSPANRRSLKRYLLILDLNGVLLDRGDFVTRGPGDASHLRPVACEVLDLA